MGILNEKRGWGKKHDKGGCRGEKRMSQRERRGKRERGAGERIESCRREKREVGVSGG